ncbi:hypothetical protein [Methylobacillus sp.]|uniref:hypothetical protein n=1 Tax=Methylobacillus sp. TaxID=56818 RepID=UPI002FE15B2C
MSSSTHKVTLDIPDIPHGHGLSFKRGVADGLLDTKEHESLPHDTHSASYQRGIALGITFKNEIAKLVKS